MKTKKEILKDLRTIPWIGPRCADDLWKLGMRKVSDLKNQDPQKLYDDLCAIEQAKVDRCMLYVLRCAVYYASHENHNAKLLEWWQWKDKA